MQITRSFENLSSGENRAGCALCVTLPAGVAFCLSVARRGKRRSRRQKHGQARAVENFTSDAIDATNKARVHTSRHTYALPITDGTRPIHRCTVSTHDGQEGTLDIATDKGNNTRTQARRGQGKKKRKKITTNLERVDSLAFIVCVVHEIHGGHKAGEATYAHSQRG